MKESLLKHLKNSFVYIYRVTITKCAYIVAVCIQNCF